MLLSRPAAYVRLVLAGAATLWFLARGTPLVHPLAERLVLGAAWAWSIAILSLPPGGWKKVPRPALLVSAGDLVLLTLWIAITGRATPDVALGVACVLAVAAMWVASRWGAPAGVPGSAAIESKLQSVLQVAHTPLVMFDANGRVEFTNRKGRELFGADLTGVTMEELLGRFSDSGALREAAKRGRALTRTSDRAVTIRRPDGDHRQIHFNMSTYAGADGQLLGMVLVCFDITDEKRLELEVRAARLRTEEAERRRIARELHDEVGQLLTGLKLTLSMPQPALEDAKGLVNDLLARVRSISLDLRPAMLDDLGLIPALLWHLERYTQQTGITVDFRHSGLERRLPPEVETAAYRVIQEALTNVARHAGVKEAAVKAWTSPEGGVLTLKIDDQGRGYDTNAPSAMRGGGVTGLRERAQLLGGTLQIESSAGKGTQITAEIPIAPVTEEKRRMP